MILMDNKMKIGNFEIGKGKTFIIAELSANHGGDFETAAKSIEAAKDAGADAVKLQTYTADTMTLNISSPHFTINGGTLWDGATYYSLYEEAAMPWLWQPKLKKIADDLDIQLFSSPFDKTAVDFLAKMKTPAYKIASFEITDIPLIKYAASKGKPMLLSTGIASFYDIKKAVEACRSCGNNHIILLKCTSSYPAPIEEANLLSIPSLAKDFEVSAGLSDHTTDNITAITAVALGSVVIEKHFILDKSINSPDKEFSLTPQEFKSMVCDIRKVEKARGESTYALTPASQKGKIFSRSIYAISNISKGEIFTEKNVASLRPAAALSPEYLEIILGQKANHDINRGDPIKKDMFK